MSRYFRCAALLALLLVAAVGCDKNQNAANPAVVAKADATAADAVMASVQLLKRNDVAGLLQHGLPPADFAKLKADWTEDQQKDPITDEDRQKFNEGVARLTAPDAEAKLWAEIQPQLAAVDAQYQQQMPMYVGMGKGWLQGIVQQNPKLSDAEKEQANAAIDALANWVQTTRFTDPDLMQQSLAIVCKAARDMKLTTLDEARALDFDQTMAKAQIAMAGAKDVLNVYGFSIDQTLDSVKAGVVSSEGDNAKVKIDYTLLGAPLTMDTDMVKVDGQWYGKSTIEQLREHEQGQAAAAAEPAESAD